MAFEPHPHEMHHPARERDRAGGGERRLFVTLGLIAGYMVAEFIGALLTNSLALLADAGHMLSDVAALALSLFALRLARRPPTPRNTYGYYRAEILAALVNGSALVAIAVYILVEALQRFRAPPAVFGPGMLAVALGGLAVNLAALRLLHGSHAESLNVRAAWLHVLSDTAGSVGAVLAAALVWGLGWRWPDPLAGVVIAVLIVYSAWLLLKETVAVLMESAPRHLDADAVRDAIARVPGVLGVHDLHIWTITSGLDALSCHVVAAELAEAKALLHAVQRVLREEFRIWHVTVQIETPGFAEP